MTEELTDPAMWSALTDPATLLFVDTLNFQCAIKYLFMETCCRYVLPIASAAFTGLLFAALLRQRGVVNNKCAVFGLVLACTFIGATKNILSRSSSDEGIVLTAVDTSVDGGNSLVTAMATGGDPAPMWYRQAASNDWTLATADGWSAVSVDHTGNVFTRVWSHSGTNAEVTAWNMWWFGNNPPAVEITATGGVSIVAAAFTGKFARFEWKVDEEIELPAGSRVVLQGRDADVQTWDSLTLDDSPSHSNTVSVVNGFFLDRKTFWRVRLEVPQQ